MTYNALHKLNDNVAAIRIALRDDKPSAEEVITLQRYCGFGGIKAILYPEGTVAEWRRLGATKEDLRLYNEIQTFHQLLRVNFSDQEYEQVTQSLKNSVLTAFYTPSFVPQVLYTAIKDQGIPINSIYEPSSGAGIFLTEAQPIFTELERVTAVEKDLLTGKVLEAVCKGLELPANVHIASFGDTPTTDNGEYDLVVSNIPFGAFSVYDPAYADGSISGKIHNYFFAKGLDKLRDGGLLAYITTDAFLNSPSNFKARKYVFSQSDFVSLSVMPANLMKETGNTEAPSHLLLLQKNNNKTELSAEEELLLGNVKLSNEYGEFNLNEYVYSHPEIICGNEITWHKNQYGQPAQKVWQRGNIEDIQTPLSVILRNDLSQRFDALRFQQNRTLRPEQTPSEKKTLTFLAIPEDKAGSDGMQLGLFSTGIEESISRAWAYLSPTDEATVQKQTARIAAVLRPEEKPDHESIVLLTAKAKNSQFYIYKIASNVQEIETSSNWLNASSLVNTLNRISGELKHYSNVFNFYGESHLEGSFGFANREQIFTGLHPHYKEETLVVLDGKIGTLQQLDSQADKALFQPFAVNGKGISFYKQYIAVRDSYFSLTRTESDLGKEQSGLRQALNENYLAFQKEYGWLNQTSNRNAILNDSLGFITLSSLERNEGEQYIKADIFTGPLFKKQEAFTTEDPVEALTHCLNERGKVDIHFIAKTTGSTEAEIIAALEQHVYLNPATNNWETADQYLSGNVVAKLNDVVAAVDNQSANRQWQRSLTAIKKVQPEKIPFEVLDFNMGERWLPTEYYQRFVSELFGTDTTVAYLPSIDSFKVKTEKQNAKTNTEFAIRPKSGKTMYGPALLENALENTSPFFTYEVEGPNGKSVRLPDNEATQLAHQKIEAVRGRFVEWLGELPSTDKKVIEDLYNGTFNCYVLREYNGSHLTFPSLERATLGIADLYDSQKNSAWRILQNRGALVDHEVGLGKTLTMVVASHEMKRLQIIQKPLILALKSNVTQIADTYRKAYPHSKILFPGEHDFTPHKRQKLFHAIKNNHWDCVILTHDQFGKIPQSPQVQKEILETELDNVDRDLETLKDLGGDVSKKMLKGLEIRKSNLRNNLREVVQKIEQKKDTDINFKELGIDHIFVDEAHKFKNLTFTTRHNRVAGLGNAEGSQKALNLLFAVRTLQQQFRSDLCATFLSGTPISNSLTEMYLLFKYLRPWEMERQRIENFDGWAAVFAKKTTDFEFSVTNEIIAKERFRHFIKVPELALFYNEITDYKTAKHINLDKPDLKEELVNLKPTGDQKTFIKALMTFAKNGDGTLIGRQPLTADEDKGKMLIATNYAKKMAVDMRLIDPVKYDDHPGNKVSVCAKRVAEIYRESAAHRGTQIIFSDLGTPKPDDFNVYDALKEKLISEYVIPAHEITFIHDWTDKRKPELFRKMNEGNIRILIGSTDKAGTGLNVQRRVVAMHHLDIPWKPSEFEQRNGRGARQGNVIAKQLYGNAVRSYIYAVEQSLDNYKFNLLKNKQTFISQMKNCELNVRTIDEGALDEKSGMNFSEYIAILSGDTKLLEKAKLEKKVAVLESLRSVHQREVARAKARLESLQRDQEHHVNVLAQLTKDFAAYSAVLRFEKDGSKSNPVQLSGFTHTDAEAIGKHIAELYIHWQPAANSTEQKIGSLYGFDCYIRQQQESVEQNGLFSYRYHNAFYVQHPEGTIKYTYNSGHPTVDNPKLAARYFINSLDRIERIKTQYTTEADNLGKDIPVLERLIATPFEKEGSLKNYKVELQKLEREITLSIQAAQLKNNYKDEGDLNQTLAAEQSLGYGNRKEWPSQQHNQRIILKRPVKKVKVRF